MKMASLLNQHSSFIGEMPIPIVLMYIITLTFAKLVSKIIHAKLQLRFTLHVSMFLYQTALT